MKTRKMEQEGDGVRKLRNLKKVTLLVMYSTFVLFKETCFNMRPTHS